MLDSYAPKQRVFVVRYISGGINVRQACPAVRVNFNTVRDPRACSSEEIDLRVDTDARDHKVALELPAGLGDDALDSLATLEPVDTVTQHELHSARAMESSDHASNLGPENTCQRGRPRIDGGHLEPKHA